MAPMTASTMLHSEKPLRPAPVIRLPRKPPMKAPTIPINIVTMMPNEPDDNTIAALLTTVAQHGRAILLFLDHASFKGWQSKLAQVLA